MCNERKPINGFWSGVTATLFFIAIAILIVGKLGGFEAKAQTPTPINKRFSQTSVRVYGQETHVLIDNQTGIACYRLSDSSGYPWSCATIRGF